MTETAASVEPPIEDDDIHLCVSFSRDPQAAEKRAAARRERELAEFRARRAQRIIELGLGSHRKAP